MGYGPFIWCLSHHCGKTKFWCIWVEKQPHGHEKPKATGHEDFLLAKAMSPRLESTFKIYKAACILGVWEYSNIGDRDLERPSILFANRPILRIMSEKYGFQANRKILALNSVAAQF